MIPLPPQALKALKEREAKEKGKLWLDEVCDSEETTFFKDYRTWAHVYEGAALPSNAAPVLAEPSVPTDADIAAEPDSTADTPAPAVADASMGPNSEPTVKDRLAKAVSPTNRAKLAKAKALLESKNENLCTLRSGVTAKLLLMTLDMACHMLQDLENSLPDQRPFINAIRALVLTYRFEKQNMRRKIFHLREIACGRLVEVLDFKLQDQTLKETQLACREGLLKMSPQNLLEQEWKAWIEAALEQITIAVAPAVAELQIEQNTIPSETVLAIAGLDPPLPYEEESVPPVRDQCLALIEALVKNKMKKVNLLVAHAVDQFLMDFAVAKFAPDTSKAALPLKEQLVILVDKQHERMLKAVTKDVSGIVDLLGDLMDVKK